MPLSIVILAAGQGKRMRSALPKVLQPVAGAPMLAHVIDAGRALAPERITVVYGHGGDAVREAFAGAGVDWCLQSPQLGTGHAVAQALPDIPDSHRVLVLCGDVPLVTAAMLEPLAAAAPEDGIALLTATLDDPTGYGRILRSPEGHVRAIVEQRDAAPDELAVREVNTGLMALPAGRLRGWLDRLGNDNAQGEYYLTDVIGFAIADGVPVVGVDAGDPGAVLGVNDRRQLAAVERVWQRRQADALLDRGATLADPARIDVRGHVDVGQDVFIDVGAVFEGRVALGDGVRIGPNCIVADSELGAGTTVHAHSVIQNARIGARCDVGPFARVRPGTELDAGARIGNFVEVKASRIGPGSKVNHLTYIGDARIDAGVNVGAGTITCNYDGANKHRTVIGEGAFIGSGVMLVAPVEIGAGATIGAGSTVTKSAPAGELTVARARQTTIEGWRRPVKQTK